MLKTAGKDYEKYANAVFSFKEAIKIWKGNKTAAKGILDAQYKYAECAFEREDYDLAVSLLKEDIPQYRALMVRATSAQRRRNAREVRMKALSRGLFALACAIVVILAIAFFWIRTEQRKTLDEKQKAEQERENAVAAKKEAVSQREAAETARKGEVEQRAKAEKALTTAELRLADAYASLGDVAIQDKDFWKARLFYASSLNIAENQRARSGIVNAGTPRVAWVTSADQKKKKLISMALSPDGKRVYCGVYGGGCFEFDAETGKRLAWLKYKWGNCRTIDVSSDGRYLATTETKRIVVWDRLNRKVIRVKEFPYEIANMRFFPDNKHIFFTTRTGKKESGVLWAIDKNRVLWETERVMGNWGLGLSPPDRSVIIQAHSWWLMTLDVKTGRPNLPVPVTNSVYKKVELTKPIPGLDAFEAEHMFLLPGEKRAVTKGEDGTLKLWSINSGKVLVSLSPMRPGNMWTMSSSNDGSMVVTAHREGAACVWYKDGKPIRKIMKAHKGEVTNAYFLPDNKRIITCGSDGAVKIWDIKSGDILVTYTGHTGVVTDCRVSPDGKWGYSTCERGTLRKWSISPNQPEIDIRNVGQVEELEISPDNEWIALSLWKTIKGKNLKLVNARTLQTRLTVETSEWPDPSMKFHPSGKYIAHAAADTAKLSIIEVESLRTIAEKKLGSSLRRAFRNIQFSEDGNTVVIGRGKMDQYRCKNPALIGWNWKTGDVKILPAPNNLNTMAVLWLPKRKRFLVTCFEQGRIIPFKAWLVSESLSNAVMAQGWQWDFGRKPSLSADGKYLAVQGKKDTIVVIDSFSFREIKRFSGQGMGGAHTRFSPDNRFLAVGWNDGYLRVWDIEKSAMVAVFECGARNCISLDWFSDSRRIATSGIAGRLCIWNIGLLDVPGKEALTRAYADTGMKVDGFDIVDMSAEEWKQVKAKYK
jgi:WD40 repeat protein